MENGALDLDRGRLLPHACWMQRALGIDTGDARIGKGALERIASVVREKAVDTLVVGLPKNMNGTKGPAALKAEAFAESLRALAPEVKIVLWDERLTTVAAQRALHEAGRNTKQSRAVIDQVAAQLILQGWLDSQAFLAQ